jgi:hypothetical protein
VSKWEDGGQKKSRCMHGICSLQLGRPQSYSSFSACARGMHLPRLQHCPKKFRWWPRCTPAPSTRDRYIPALPAHADSLSFSVRRSIRPFPGATLIPVSWDRHSHSTLRFVLSFFLCFPHLLLSRHQTSPPRIFCCNKSFDRYPLAATPQKLFDASTTPTSFGCSFRTPGNLCQCGSEF